MLQAMELSTETRFSSKIMSPSFALASVEGLSGGVNDFVKSAEKSGTGGEAPGFGGWAEANIAAPRIPKDKKLLVNFVSRKTVISTVPKHYLERCNYLVNIGRGPHFDALRLLRLAF